MKRMITITVDVETSPCVFIRFNPDVWKINKNTKRVGFQKRCEYLTERINYWLDYSNVENADFRMHVEKLYYDDIDLI